MNKKYNILKNLELIDESDILLYLSSLKNINEKIQFKKKILNYKYSYYNLHSEKIQKKWREYYVYTIFIDNLFRKKKNVNYYNKTNFLGIPIEQINPKYFFSYYDNKHYYAFDIRELYEIIKYNKKNPYTTKPFSKYIIKKINRIVKRYKLDSIYDLLEDDIPICSLDSAKIASIFNHLSHIGVYADMNKFLSFTSLQYVYFIQDLVSNKIIEKSINKTHYNQVIKIYKNTYYSNKSKLKKIRNFILEIISDLTNTRDDLLYTRALLIAEQINYDYNQEIDQNSTDDEYTENSNKKNIPIAPPMPKSLNISYRNIMNNLNKKIESLIENIEDISNFSNEPKHNEDDSLSDNDSLSDKNYNDYRDDASFE